jgi:dihydroorotate dehydrogenase
MIGALYPLLRPALMRLDAEDAHRLALHALRAIPMPATQAIGRPVKAFGLTFPNAVGLAAGFDKNGEAVDGLFRLGFGFVEIGSVTPRPQAGNPRPRLFRLPLDQAVINRFGFNNDGHEAVRRRLAARRGIGIVGVNVGANRDSGDKAADYASGIRAFAALASYFTINISSPNTPGLRDLQKREALDALLARVAEAREDASRLHPRRPVLLKIAPDLSLAELDDVVAMTLKHGLDGMVVGNTTLSRPGSLKELAVAQEAGGLSGPPLFALSTQILAEVAKRVEGRFPLIGVGGIDSPAAAQAKLEAGATLVQLYTALVYHGPGLVSRIAGRL